MLLSNCVKQSCGSTSCRRHVLVRLTRIAAVRSPRSLSASKEFLRLSPMRFHLVFTYIVVNGHGVVLGECVQFLPLSQGVVPMGCLGNNCSFHTRAGRAVRPMLLAQFQTLRHRKILDLLFHRIACGNGANYPPTRRPILEFAVAGVVIKKKFVYLDLAAFSIGAAR